MDPSIDPSARWTRLLSQSFHHDGVGVALDFSALGFDDDAWAAEDARVAEAMEGIASLEGGAIANPDEGRRVGHYWLRAPELAPDEAIRAQIWDTVGQVESFAQKVRKGALAPERAERFRHVVVVGIGGSALGPQLVCDALATAESPLAIDFLDNTDPDGVDRLVDGLGDALEATLCVVISKSGGTKETRNGMLAMRAAYQARGLDFGKHAAAVTGVGSKLDAFAEGASFLARFPMWDWVGGRTSVMSAVGLLPAALVGVDIRAFLSGARQMDKLTRRPARAENPAAQLALAWWLAGEGKGRKNMVVLPYKDRLGLMARYLQQLVMESLGKELDLEGRTVHQGITVYGNKGSTDQHAYVQQLYAGQNDFFVTFLEVLRDRDPARPTLEVEPGIRPGDYLAGFLHGTRQALADRGRGSLTITLDEVSAASVGALIALYERAVGIYALLAGINAYHQPAVEYGKRAAGAVLELQTKLLAALAGGAEGDAEGLARHVGSDDPALVFRVLRHLAANGRAVAERGDDVPSLRARYRAAPSAG